MRRNTISATTGQGGLSISEVAERTGVPPATLRSWEARYGRPRPERLPGGHRRYTEGDVTLVEEALRQRAAGMGLRAALQRASARAAGLSELSVFAGLRRRHPELMPHILTKATLLALTRAMEDECCARAERPVLFAGFQRQRFYRESRARWTELARTADSAVVFADFPEYADCPEYSAEGPHPVEVPLPPAAPLRREWVLVCAAPDRPACLAAWELPGQERAADRARRFETVWAVDPDIVRDAARICAEVTELSAPSLGSTLTELLPGAPPMASADLRRASGLLNRMLGYLAGTQRR